KQVEDGGRIRRRQILNPAEERGVTGLDGYIKNFIEREENRDLYQDRQAARHRVDLLLFIQGHQRLLLFDLVVAIAFGKAVNFRLQLLHLAHRLVGFVCERKESQLEQHRDDQDPYAEIADEPIEEIERVEHRLGNEAEPAPVDHQLEFVDP